MMILCLLHRTSRLLSRAITVYISLDREAVKVSWRKEDGGVGEPAVTVT
jgi:hypothetical protein